MVEGVCAVVFVVGAVKPVGFGPSAGSGGAAGRGGVPVAESPLAPPGPIPEPVGTQRSAGEYCRGDAAGGEAAAGAPLCRAASPGSC